MKRKRGSTLGDFFANRRASGVDGLPSISVTLNDGLIARNELERRTDTALTPEQHLRVYKGDIAYNMMRMWQGASGLAESDGIVSPAYVVLQPKPGIDGRFARHWFKSARMIYLFWAYSHGLTEDRLRLYFDDFCKIPAQPPPLRLQTQVADAIDAWDHVIELIGRLAALKRRRQAFALHHLVGQQQSASARHYKWERAELRDLVTFQSGNTPDRSDETLWGNHLPWVSAKDLKTFDLVGAIEGLTSKGAAQASVAPEGTTLLLVRGMGLFKDIPVGVTVRPVAFNQDVKALIPKVAIHSRFLAHALRSRRAYLMNHVDRAGHGTGRLSTDLLEALPISFPVHEDEQSRIVTYLDLCEREVVLTEAAAATLRTQRRGLLERMLSGRPPVNTTASMKLFGVPSAV